jgi:hypothetical protein
MEHPTTPSSGRHVVSRRQAIVAGTVGAAATAFLASCSTLSATNTGRSGTPTSTTLVAPTVPRKAPTADALDEDITLLRTGTSLELLVSKVYDTYGPKLEDPAWAAAAVRFSTDHASAAETFQSATVAAKRVDKPNAFFQKNTIDPVEETLTSDAAILDLFHGLESTLAATYVDAAGTFTTAAWRARVMTFASASARRATVLDNGGKGAAPTEALYPLRDLIPALAYELSTPKPAGPG